MKPVILITAKFLNDPYNFGVGGMCRVKENYCHAIIRAGGVPVMSALGDAATYAKIADGILFTGGSDDINPLRYGDKPYCEEAKWNDRIDDMELRLFEEFYKLKKPMLGICRGIQLINVAMGGTLIQDIPSMVEMSAHKESIIPDKKAHMVKSAEGSVLRKLFGEEFVTNTHHHQAVKKCGKGLYPAAVTDEGVIEAVEHETLPIIGIQWHPERMIGDENLDMTNMMPLFEHFVNLCKEQAEK